MQLNNLKHALGIIVLAISLYTYTMTVQPTVPFWDCGEFTASAVHQQVPHPPGAPLFLMIGKLFHLIPIGDEAVRVNMVSVVASAFTCWLLYYIIIMTINWFRKKSLEEVSDALSVYGSALIGALAFTFSDTFWFNAVESEVYASSSLFVAIVVYMMMKWNEQADTPGNEKYLLMIAYLIGLSTGVHLLAVLCIFSMGMIIYFRKYDFSLKGFLITGVLTVIVFALVYPGIVKWYPSLLAGDSPFKNDAMEHSIEDSPLLQLIGVGILIAAMYGAWLGWKKNRYLLNLACSSFLLIFIGYTTYTHILIRSNANPPMNENAPKDFSKLISYLGREQYGDAPSYPRRFETNDQEKIARYKEYGDWNPPPIKTVQTRDGMRFGMPDYSRMKMNTAGEMKYLFDYQLDHMYLRYFLWNFVGKTSDVQDAEDWSFTTSRQYIEAQNFGSGFASHFPVRFFYLPLLFGVVGIFFHFKRDPRTALVFLTMFLVMGVVAAYAQNQQNPQPRERDYFYTGSFMVWCLWIGLGAYELVMLVRAKVSGVAAPAAVLAVGLIAVPFNMAYGGWNIHSRAGNYLPFDYSYNILQSCEKNAILFTNGDNDTFPLWLLQDVYGVRRDIRIVNLSLGNTPWYIYQLKNQEPWGAQKIPLTFTDESLLAKEYSRTALMEDYGPAKYLSIPISKELMSQYTTDPTMLNNPVMNFTFTGNPSQKDENGTQTYRFSVAQRLIGDIVKTTKLERPIYFSVTVGQPGSPLYCGLSDFVRMEGMAYKLCPVRQNPVPELGFSVNTDITEKCLMHLKDGDTYSKEQDYGFKLRNLNTPSVYYDEHHRRYVSYNYNSIYVHYALGCIAAGQKDKAIAALDTMRSRVSETAFPMDIFNLRNVALAYLGAGATTKARELADDIGELSTAMVSNPYIFERDEYKRYSTYPVEIFAADVYEKLKDYKRANEWLNKVSNPNFRSQLLQRIQQNEAMMKGDTGGLSLQMPR